MNSKEIFHLLFLLIIKEFKEIFNLSPKGRIFDRKQTNINATLL